jgi:hypothetical protein
VAKIGDLVHIVWEDHYGYGRGGWRSRDDIDISPFYCETVGWVVAQDKNSIATSAGIDGNEKNKGINSNIAVCPKRVIKSIKVLKKGNPAHWKKD